MQFYNEMGLAINHLAIEREEQLQAERFIHPASVVLEIGARYGTVSCIISKKLNNQKNLVAVEPDERVWCALEENMIRNGCDFNILKGVISKKPIILAEKNSYGGYGTTSILAESSPIPNYSLEEIEARYGLRFNTLVADCEGFLEVFFDENPSFYDQLSLILFEKDYPHKCNYNKIIANLRAKGFRQLVAGFHEVWQKI
jgi:FkbM family methyltransferase